MKTKIMIALFGGLIATSAVSTLRVNAQQPPASAQEKPKMMQGKQMQGNQMMTGEMMGQSMMSMHQEMSRVLAQVTSDLAALQDEENPALIKKHLAADHALLDQLRTQMQQQRGAMDQMMDQMKMMDKMKSQLPAK